MKLTAQVKLQPTPFQAQALQATLERANAACNWISSWAWEHQTFRQYDLHKGCYREVRERFGLAAQASVRAIAKVADAYKLYKNTQRVFSPTGAIAFDERILRWQVSKSQVSIWTLAGRLTIPFVCGERQSALLATQQGESDLYTRGGKWYLSATCNVEEPPPADTAGGVLGVDLGICNLVVDSEGNTYTGEGVSKNRTRMQRLRGILQHRGSKDAKRHLKRLRRKQARYQRDVNHVISKEVVETAVITCKAIALEELKDIRARATGFNREMRQRMGNWGFHQLRAFIEYKARRAGVAVIVVDPRDTSRTCSECGYCDKANRPTRSHFKCLQCGSDALADWNAAVNIGARAAMSSGLMQSAA